MQDKILIIDDSPANLDSLKELFSADYIVDTANSADEAIGKIGNASYKVLIMDVKMPEMDGIELYKELKKRDNDFKAIFYSAYPGEYQKAKECSELGLYVRKGKIEDLEALISAVDTLTGGGA
jgi:CheY-like chemotaxis protein